MTLGLQPEHGTGDAVVAAAGNGRHRLVDVAVDAAGAVVLERKEQYDRHGLTPVDPDTVPTIPEPGTATLFAAALAYFGLRRPARRRDAAVRSGLPET